MENASATAQIDDFGPCPHDGKKFLNTDPYTRICSLHCADCDEEMRVATDDDISQWHWED